MDIPQTTAFVNLDAIRANFMKIRGMVGEKVAVMAIVKSNAYGHGAKRVCAELEECGADWFGVARLCEALELRRSGVTKPILILGYTDPGFAKLLYSEQLTQTVFGEQYATALSDAAIAAGVTVKAHIKLDTGMTRLGFQGADGASLADAVEPSLALKGLYVTGIFTHFAVSDELTESGRSFTEMQGRLFADTVSELERRGHTFRWRHACNSAGTMYYKDFHFDMVRPGIVLYGYSPTGDDSAEFTPAMELRTVVESVKTVEQGTTVSYGREYTASGETRIAAVAAGYADGIHRSLSGNGMLWINGNLAPMIGRICMDQMMADVTGLDVKTGDQVTVFGGDSPITANNVAALCGTNSYECICAVAKRVPRVYIKNGFVETNEEI